MSRFSSTDPDIQNARFKVQMIGLLTMGCFMMGIFALKLAIL